MSAEARALVHTLWLLRAIRTIGTNSSAMGLIQQWSHPHQGETIHLRIATYVEEQCDAAVAFINGSVLTDEQKVGVLQTLSGLRAAFALSNLQTSFSNFLPHVDASLSQISFLTAQVGEGRRPPEADELVGSIETMMRDIENATLDTRVAETARKHLHILATMLRNVEIMGVDAAYASYFEMCIRMQREARTASKSTREKIKELWPEIERWGGRIAIIEKAVEAGTSLLHHADGAFHLLISSMS